MPADPIHMFLVHSQAGVTIAMYGVARAEGKAMSFAFVEKYHRKITVRQSLLKLNCKMQMNDLYKHPTVSSVYLSVNVCWVWGGGGLLVKGGCRWILYSRGWQLEHRGLPGPEDSIAASISIFSSKVQSFMAAMAALRVSRRKVRGMSQKTCWGPRLMLFPVSVISSMLAMAGLSVTGKIQMAVISVILNYNIQLCFYISQISKG